MAQSLKFKPINIIEANLGLENGGEVHAFFTASCAKAMDKYVPYDKGNLAETVIKDGQPTENVTVDSITYMQPYAHYVYTGISKSGKPLNYQKDKHPLAKHHWDIEMWNAEKNDIIRQTQNFLESRKNNGS